MYVAHDSKLDREVAFAVLRTHVRAFHDHEPGARLGEEPEELHDMRVASRRVRAAISLFRDVLPVRVLHLREELRWVGSFLGAVRDLDVQLEQVEEWEGDMPEGDRTALAPLVDSLRERRVEARARMLASLDSRRFERLTASMDGLLRRGPLRRSRASRVPAVVVAPELIRWRYRKFRRAGGGLHDGSPPEDVHELRIRAKRLRYALEFLGPLEPKRSQRLIRRLVAVQDALGSFQDAQVAMAHIDDLVREGEFPARAVFLLGRVSERYARQAEDLRRASLPLLGRVRGRAWKRLRRKMDRARTERLATVPPRPTRGSTASPVPPGEDPPGAKSGAPTPPGDGGPALSVVGG